MKYISAKDFRADPKNLDNATELRNAVKACVGKNPTTLTIPPGVYHFKDEEAIELRDLVMGGAFGKAFERMMFFPYAPYVKGLDFNGCENVIVDAEGVTLLIHGWMEPISLENCKNITINGITIDYDPKPFSIGKITNLTEKYFDIEIYPEYPITEKTVCSRTIFWNATKNELLRNAIWPDSEYLGTQKVRYNNSLPKTDDQIIAMITHTLHFRPAILFHECDNITLNHVTIHSQPGMGIVGNRGKNITLNNLKIIPSPGLHISSNTDATHFTACSGSLIFDNCEIVGAPDDSTNIHCYYHSLSNRTENTNEGDTVELRVNAPTGTHAQVLDYHDVGDELELVEIDTLRTETTYKVIAVEKYEEKWYNKVTLDGKLPKEFQKYYLSNVSHLPKVIIRNCNFHDTGGRLLIKNRNVLIENNKFINCLGSGVSVYAEESWKEGITCQDIIIRNNEILNCSVGIEVGLSAKKTDISGINKRIEISNNTIRSEYGGDGIIVTCSEDVKINENKIRECNIGIKVKHTKKIQIKNNSECRMDIGEEVKERDFFQ